MRSGELAAAAGVSSDTLRHYERAGLLAPPKRLANGYRAYPPEALALVLLIQRGLAIGFSLAELAVFLKARKAGAHPCKRVHALASERLADLDRQIERLTAFRDDFRRILEDWSGRLEGTAEGSPARLLESLTSQSIAEPAASPLRALRFVHQRKKARRTP